MVQFLEQSCLYGLTREDNNGHSTCILKSSQRQIDSILGGKYVKSVVVKTSDLKENKDFFSQTLSYNE